MTDQVRITYEKTGDIAVIDGVPMNESAITAEIGPCIYCERLPEDSMGGELINISIANGVLRGDAVCGDCMIARGQDMDGFDAFMEGIDDD